jgi:hypothetical protein
VVPSARHAHLLRGLVKGVLEVLVVGGHFGFLNVVDLLPIVEMYSLYSHVPFIDLYGGELGTLLFLPFAW